jgi:hypothetical protein
MPPSSINVQSVRTGRSAPDETACFVVLTMLSHSVPFSMFKPVFSSSRCGDTRIFMNLEKAFDTDQSG